MLNPSGLCQCGCGERTRIAHKNYSPLGWVKGEPIKRLPGHGRKNSNPEYIVDERTGCWLWQRGVSASGYGRTGNPVNGTRTAHVVIYEREVGLVPAGLVLDHLCRVRHCVNPDHLEPVTDRENIRRGEAPNIVLSRLNICKRGHSLDQAYVYKDGRRQCRACNAATARRYRAERSRARLDGHGVLVAAVEEAMKR